VLREQLLTVTRHPSTRFNYPRFLLAGIHLDRHEKTFVYGS
jgi:hypothetical protein